MRAGSCENHFISMSDDGLQSVAQTPLARTLMGPTLWAVAACLVSSLVTAQTAGIPRRGDGRPDINGIWQTLGTANWNLEGQAASPGAVETLGAIGAVPAGLGVVEGGSIPYLPDAKRQRDANFVARRTEDPEAKCFMPGVPRATYLSHPFQIFQTDGDILLTYEFAGAVRNIFMSEHIEPLIESWMGWSNGRWDGDTLVVDVGGQNGQTWLDRAGNFASANVRVTERYTLMGPNHMQYEATVEDASVYSRPWTISMPLYRRVEPSARIMEFKCVAFAEQLMYGHLSKSADDSAATGDVNE